MFNTAVTTCIFCRQPGHAPVNCPNKKTDSGSMGGRQAPQYGGGGGGALDLNVAVQPIESLTPFIGNKWVIKARVTDKSPVRTWTNTRSNGKLFSMTLLDGSGAIRATIFQEGVDKFYDMLTEGNVYLFTRGQVKTANKKFSTVKCEYEISFDKDTEIIQVRNTDPTTQTIPQKSFNFAPLASLQGKEVGSNVDILAVVASVGEASTIISKKGGQTLIKRSVMIADTTAQIELTVWDVLAQAWDCPPGSVIALKMLRIQTFNDSLTLSMGQSSGMDQNLDLPEAARLSSWYQSLGGAITVPNLSKQTEGGSGGSDRRQAFDDISNLNLGKGEKADYLNIRGVITYINQKNMYYDACPTCNRKVTPVGMDGNQCRCEHCDKILPASVARYMVSMMISDGLSNPYVTVFNEQAEKIFGVTADVLKQAAASDDKLIGRLCSSRMFSQVIANVRVKEDTFGEGESRMKLSLANVHFLQVPKDSQILSTPAFGYETRLLLRDIDTYFA